MLACDFTHWSRARRASAAILDVVSRKWLATLITTEETSIRVGACFLAALDTEDLLELCWRATVAAAISGNGPRMRSVTTRKHAHGVQPRELLAAVPDDEMAGPAVNYGLLPTRMRSSTRVMPGADQAAATA